MLRSEATESVLEAFPAGARGHSVEDGADDGGEVILADGLNHGVAAKALGNLDHPAWRIGRSDWGLA